ncbi:MAG: VOC family protein [Gammaproteobacteria bacterium]|nr:VOC family protein [Gammaproteobacteria bacterium]MDH4253150.1 VOC family protein [Gammaproteobacteria bacterium]MDH5308488.1 VOC family protein [Gammaproteobacteria bacterium]
MKSIALPTLLLLAAGPQAFAQQPDVTFFVIGKHANFQQDAQGIATPVDYSFFSEIFLASGGDGGDATLALPGGETIPYRDMRDAEGGARDNILLVTGAARYPDFDALQARYPNGTYRVSFATPSGAVDSAGLQFRERPLPPAPRIHVEQDGVPGCSQLAAGIDTTVRWSPFSAGRPDPNGILDDLVFVILEDAAGIRVAHSGRPFEGKPYLTYAAAEYVIPGDVLEPGSTYTLSVEHALLDDTGRHGGVPAFTTRAVTTRLALPTLPAGATGCRAAGIPPLAEQITMLYYENIDAPTRFYGGALGLEQTFELDWIRMYRTGPASMAGIVREGPGAWHEAQPNNAVMLSLVTPDVDAWYARLKTRDDIVFLKDIGDGGRIRSFLLEDPGGYTVEFFQWLMTEP